MQGVEQPRLQGWYAPRVRGALAVVGGLAARRRPPAARLRLRLLPRAEGPTDLRFEHDAFRLTATLETGGQAYAITVVQGEIEW